MSISQREDKINEFWKKNKIFEKSVERDAPRGNYIFYDGPPFITGIPHYATLLPSIVKDAVPRFWTMKGFRVERKWGWDCHGLPAENQVEKELGLKNKKDVESLGVGKFVEECKSYVSRVSDQWRWYVDKIARWVDMDNDYKTMDSSFMESVIWSFKELYSKGLIYEGYRTSLHCPRCATPLSKFEITMDAGSYKDVTEISVVIKFKLKNSSKLEINQDVYVLAWTTTPWTLPGNLALAVNKNIDYNIVKVDRDIYVLAKERTEEILSGKKYELIKTIKGEKLNSMAYEPLFNLENNTLNKDKNIYKIYSADFVTTEDGTGVVHIAPNFGEDDFEFGKTNKLPLIEIMEENGVYTKEAGEWEGCYFKDANKEVLKKLENKLFSKFNYTHSYPFCYRCQTPLIYRTQKAWYLDIDKIRDELIKTNENINWIPDYFKHGRFKYNLETAPPWCLSRSRYWGSPIPVWKCEKCSEIKVVGSIREIEQLSGKKVVDLHRPKIDEHEFRCSCGSVMKRVPEILDCWFESGAMPHAQWHYPFERKDEFNKMFPADFIIEYTGQLRGWFYYLHVLSNSLFNSECFKNVLVTGVLYGTDGRKMSKSYGNYPDPRHTLEKYGGDALRMYFLSSPIITGMDINLSEKEILESLRKNVMLLENIYQFYILLTSQKKEIFDIDALDNWISARYNQLIKEVTFNMEKYELPSAARLISVFIEDLSWYVRLKREKLGKNKNSFDVLKDILENLSKIIAPFMPFMAEYIWQNITTNNFERKNKSVHLEEWPKANEKVINLELIKEINLVRETISLGLAERDKAKIGVKWPLSLASISYYKPFLQNEKEFQEIIMSQLNVKGLEIMSGSNEEIMVELDTTLTPELEAEGYAREMSRQIQEFRKNLKLKKEDKVKTFIITEQDLKNILNRQIDFIRERTNSDELNIVTTNKKRFKNTIEFKIRDKRGSIAIITTS